MGPVVTAVEHDGVPVGVGDRRHVAHAGVERLLQDGRFRSEFLDRLLDVVDREGDGGGPLARVVQFVRVRLVQCERRGRQSEFRPPVLLDVLLDVESERVAVERKRLAQVGDRVLDEIYCFRFRGRYI